jgi:hypothetical protein
MASPCKIGDVTHSLIYARTYLIAKHSVSQSVFRRSPYTIVYWQTLYSGKTFPTVFNVILSLSLIIV